MRNTILNITEVFSDYSHLIGVPYEELDCWDLVRQFYKDILLIDIPDFRTYLSDAVDMEKVVVEIARPRFKEIGTPQFGDIVLIRFKRTLSHVGIYLGGNKLLHSREITGSVVDNFGKYNKVIEGFYTWS